SRHGISNCILRVPITFPPEKLRGVQLSAMCVPDLRGTQGMFSHYTTRHGRDDQKKTGGDVHHVDRQGNTVRASLVGPENPLLVDRSVLKTSFEVVVKDNGLAMLKVNGAKYELRLGEYTDWVTVRFRAAPGVTVHGVCKFLLLATQPEFELYVT